MRENSRSMRADEIEPLPLERCRLARLDVLQRLAVVRLDDRRLMLRGQEAVAEQAHAAMRHGRVAALQHDVARQIARLGAEPVARPRARAGIAEERKARVHEEIPLRMLAELRRHGADDAQLIRDGAHVRKQIAHRQAALPIALEGPVRGLHDAVVVELRALHGHRQRLAGVFLQQRLRIKRVHMRHAAAHVAERSRCGPSAR